MEGVVAGKKKKAEMAIKELMETGRVLRFARTTVKYAEREVSGMDQQPGEGPPATRRRQPWPAWRSSTSWSGRATPART